MAHYLGIEFIAINTFNMKKIFYFSLVLPLIMISCEKTPVAVFHTDTVEPEVGHEVTFYNDSQDANRFEWDFGDGFLSKETNPRHSFNATGTYEVKLTAISKSDLEDQAFLTLNVLVPTLLEIQVLEYVDEYVVPGASIILYPTIADWDAETNKITEGFTDQYGIAVFAGLENADHYLDIAEQNHNNWALRAEDPEFVHIMEVIPHQINRFTAWVDYVGPAKGIGRQTRSAVIRKLVRKASDKRQPPFDSSTENWQDLYKRRVNK
jgi:PKD repeat protein